MASRLEGWPAADVFPAVRRRAEVQLKEDRRGRCVGSLQSDLEGRRGDLVKILGLEPEASDGAAHKLDQTPRSQVLGIFSQGIRSSGLEC